MCLGSTDVARIEPSRRCRHMIGLNHGACHVLAAVVHHPRWYAFVAKETRFARGFRGGYGFSFVENHLPARRKVVGDEPRRVDVGDLFHWFCDLQLVRAVTNGEQTLREQDVLAGMRRIVDARARRGPDPADAEQVGHEREMPAVECEENGTTRQLALGLVDLPNRSRRQRQLGLENAIGPRDGDEIELRRSAQTKRDRLETLAAERLRPVLRERRPL